MTRNLLLNLYLDKILLMQYENMKKVQYMREWQLRLKIL